MRVKKFIAVLRFRKSREFPHQFWRGVFSMTPISTRNAFCWKHLIIQNLFLSKIHRHYSTIYHIWVDGKFRKINKAFRLFVWYIWNKYLSCTSTGGTRNVRINHNLSKYDEAFNGIQIEMRKALNLLMRLLFRFLLNIKFNQRGKI